jgi:hypothetical protein
MGGDAQIRVVMMNISDLSVENIIMQFLLLAVVYPSFKRRLIRA